MPKIKFTIITLFQETLEPYLNTSMMWKAKEKGIAEFNFVNLRDFGLESGITIPAFESVAFERGVTLETDTPDTLDAYGSLKDLEQLAAILIDNAVKHSEDGGTVQVTLSQSTQRQGLKQVPLLELRVSNTGDEITAEALPHLFDRFYRVDESRTHKDNSYGLGLAIAKGLAEKNQGTITVTSENGLTEFSLHLPISQ